MEQPEPRTKAHDVPTLDIVDVVNVTKDNKGAASGKAIALGKAPLPSNSTAGSKKEKMRRLAVQNSQPDFEFVKRTTYHQAVLYYKYAKKKNTKEAIKKALEFYSQNMSLLLSEPVADSVKFQIEELATLMKKLEKNDK